MRTLVKVATLIGLAWLGNAEPAAAQTFDERWSIVPRANAAPSPPVELQEEPQPDAQSSNGADTTRGPRESPTRKSRRTFSGKASFYSYGPRKTASGSLFNRDALTAAHRSLPFGTRVRVTDVTTDKSVVVVITDRGPKLPGRVLDLSLGAARKLEITDRGVVHVRAEVL